MREILEQLAIGQNLSAAQAAQGLDLIVSQKITPAQAGAFLMGLRQKGETVEEINGFLDVLNKHMVKVQLNDPDAIDVCGTGGDGKGTFNVSTAVAFVLAACGVTVAKHGNRSISSKAGSADVLEALGIRIQLSPEEAKRCADEIGITFFFAPLYHPAMKAIGPHRKSLAIRTVFNMLGPLLNPARVKRQLIGAFNLPTAEILARVLQARKVQMAMVVHSEDGMDEISPFAKNFIFKVDQNTSEPELIEFSHFKKVNDLENVKGDNALENAKKILNIFRGKKDAAREIVLLNAAFALIVAGKANDFKEAYGLAEEAIDSGRALAKITAFKELTRDLVQKEAALA